MATTKAFVIVLFLFFSMIMMAQPAEAAPIRDFPVTLVQPDGEVIKCFVSGDEYFNYYHDAKGYKIIQDPATGYYTYAIEKEGKFAPSQYRVNKVSPEALKLPKSLTPSKTPKDIRKELINQFPFRSLDNTQPAANAPKTGTINNIVVFIRFSGEAGYTDPISTYSSMFNSTTTGANSMRNYFAEASYNQLTVSTTFYPTQTGTTVISYQDGQPRGYYQPYSVTNTIGYDPNVAWNDWSNTNGSSYREFSLINHATNAINSLVPTFLNIDGDGDGNVDNVCFIVSGSPGAWNSLLWPHQWSLYYQNAYINNKRVFTYNLQLRDFTLDSRIGVSVLAHEMFHSLGAPDLYHYSQVEPAKSLHPAGPWDLMDSVMNPPEHMMAYMKQRYGNWIASIPTITTSGTYTLNPLTSANDNAYRINSPNTTTEYFIVEYRRRTGTFETSLPGEGLIVSRINTAQDGHGNSQGPPDEVYVYRPGGTVSANGSPDSANFGSTVSRTAINDSTNPSSFLTNGAAGGLNISNIGTAGNTISFTVTIGSQPPTVSLGEALDNTLLTWTTTGNANWFGQTLTTHDGVDAAQSGTIIDNQASHLETTVTGPGTLTYYWKVSSEANYDYLKFKLDGTEQFSISGEVNWQQKTVDIPSGQHTISWSYSKDGSVNGGQDAGWVDQVVSPVLPPVNFLLTVSKNGQGTVISNPAGIDCGKVCSANYTAGISVTLTATPQTGYTFGSWAGDCIGTAQTCTLLMDDPEAVVANFKANQTIIFGAAPTIVVGGIGTVSATGGASGNPVTFSSTTPAVCTTSGANGSTVAGVATGTCTIAANQAGNADYNPAPQVTQSFAVTVITGFTLTVNNLNLPGGSVTSNPAGINCGKVCSNGYASGTIVDLQATPRDGYLFSGWGGVCSGYANTCTLTINTAKTVTANFEIFKKKRSPSWRVWLLSQ